MSAQASQALSCSHFIPLPSKHLEAPPRSSAPPHSPVSPKGTNLTLLPAVPLLSTNRMGR